MPNSGSVSVMPRPSSSMLVTARASVEGSPAVKLTIEPGSLVSHFRRRFAAATGLALGDIDKMYVDGGPAVDLSDDATVDSVGIGDGTTVVVDLKTGGAADAPQGIERRIADMVLKLATTGPSTAVKTTMATTTASTCLQTTTRGSGKLPPLAGATPPEERRLNWDGLEMTRNDFIDRYGKVDGAGLWRHAPPVVHDGRMSTVNLRKLPSSVAADIAEYLKYSEANGELTPQQRVIARQVLSPLEKNKNQMMMERDILDSPDFADRMNKYFEDFIEGRKEMNKDRREAVKTSPFRLKVHNFLTDWRVELMLTCLLILDIIFVIIAINLEIAALEAEVSDCEGYTESIYGDCAALDSNCTTTHHRYARSADAATESSCSCEEIPHHFGSSALHNAEEGVRWTSVGILGVFLLEGIMHMIEMGRRFFTEDHGMHVADFMIVAVALTFEAYTFKNLSNAFIFLIIGRLWRFVLFWHGMKHSETKPMMDMSFHILEHIPEIIAQAMEDHQENDPFDDETLPMVKVSRA
eukprot:m.25680 g.25680  ORF g.25680 m.25680 type:complete len:524 (-) comp4261_c0_seq2:206-1777(-)